MTDPVPLEEEDAAGDAAEDAALATGLAATGLVATAGESEGATVTKMPPGLPVAPEPAAVVAAVADDPPSEPAEGATVADTALPQAEPVAVWRALLVARPSCSTELPGSGKRRSVESTVWQPLPMLATNMFGRASYADVSRVSRYSSRLEAPPDNVTGAQFMYISRFPILLNQVQARVAFPVGMSVGTVKLYVSGSTASALLPLFPLTPLIGQPPSMEWMTFHVLLVVGFSS